MESDVIIDYDSELNRLKKELTAIQGKIAELEAEKKKAEQQRYNELHQYSTNSLGETYRVATEKMLDFAHAVEHADLDPNGKSDLLTSKGGLILSIYEYKTKFFPSREDDDFELIHSYLIEWAPVAHDIWSINKNIHAEQRQHEWENSWEYQDMKDRKELYKLQEEEERRTEEERRRSRVYDSDGGYWEYGGPSSVYVDKFGET